jgi:zinc protease
MASTPQNYFQQEFYTYLNKRIQDSTVPTDKSWADTDYKLAYENTKSVLQMLQILIIFFVGNDATIEAYAANI